MARPKKPKNSKVSGKPRKPRKKPPLGKKKRKSVNSRALGRPTIYNPDYHPEKVYRLCLLGLKDSEIAEAMDIVESTFNLWKLKYPEFSESIKRGKVWADVEVVEKLRERALGYSHPEEKFFQYEGSVITIQTTKHYPPDTAAAYIWLKNRRRQHWGDDRPEDKKPLPKIILRCGPDLEAQNRAKIAAAQAAAKEAT